MKRLSFFTNKLQFTLLEDTYQPEQEAFIGNQRGGRVFLFLSTWDLIEYSAGHPMHIEAD